MPQEPSKTYQNTLLYQIQFYVVMKIGDDHNTTLIWAIVVKLPLLVRLVRACPLLHKHLRGIPHKNVHMFQASHTLQSGPVPKPKNPILCIVHSIRGELVNEPLLYEIRDERSRIRSEMSLWFLVRQTNL